MVNGQVIRRIGGFFFPVAVYTNFTNQLCMKNNEKNASCFQPLADTLKRFCADFYTFEIIGYVFKNAEFPAVGVVVIVV